MLKRLEGAVMIINTFMPLIVLLGMTALAWAFVHTVREAARDPLARIDASIDRMDDAISKARQAAGVLTYEVDERVAQPIKTAVEKISGIPVSIHITMPDLKIPDANLPLKPKVSASLTPFYVHVEMEKLRVRMPTIPGIKLPETPIPGLFQLKQAFIDVFDILARFVDVLKQIAGIGALGEEAATVLAATGDLVAAARQSTTGIVTAAVVLFYLMVGWGLLSYVMWAHRRLRIGWSLVRGLA
jgi:hypothetical protein